MKKYILTTSFLSVILFGGCSYFKFSAAMCEQIAKDPTATIPQECIDYNEAEAEKAFNKTKVKTSTDVKEDLEFHKKEK